MFAWSALILALFASNEEEVSQALRHLTGGPCRFVWTRLVATQEPVDFCSHRETSRLMGFDTEDGRGERILIHRLGSYARPMFVPGGRQVIYSNRLEGLIHVVDWMDGTNTVLGSGFASDVWRDPQTDEVWVYARRDMKKGETTENRMVRVSLQDPGREEVVWDRTPLGFQLAPWFDLSADGKRAAGAFPWPACGVADLETSEWTLYNEGCWSSLSPDNSYRFFNFTGSHRWIALYDANAERARRIPINGSPSILGRDVYYPRWTNHPRYLTLMGPTSPYTGKDAELHLARFDPEFEFIEEYVRVTFNDGADMFGDAWITNTQKPAPAPKLTAEAPLPPESPDRSLVLRWQNRGEQNFAISGGERLALRGRLRGQALIGHHDHLELRRGSFVLSLPDVGPPLIEANAMSLEFSFRLNSFEETRDGALLAWEDTENSPLLRLNIRENNFYLSLDTDTESPKEIELAPVNVDGWSHFMLGYRPGHLVAYLNGLLLISTDLVQGTVRIASKSRLRIGDNQADRLLELEGLEIRSEFPTHSRVAGSVERHLQRVQSREDPRTIVTEARLVETTKLPTVSEIAPYRRCLVENLYKIVRVLEGSLIETRVIVCQWAILDATPVARQFREGDIYRLSLQAFEDHPQLESERRVSTLSHFDLPMFVERNLGTHSTR